jgi:hypothetical protein
MFRRFQDCAPWLTWKLGGMVAAIVLVGGIALGASGGQFAFLGATPMLAIAVCMLPCLLPLALFRRNKE